MCLCTLFQLRGLLAEVEDVEAYHGLPAYALKPHNCHPGKGLGPETWSAELLPHT